jgi:pimeloyl-ACP methyl ester carboxylesterase
MISEEVSWKGALGRLAATRLGPATGRTVVLLPGFTCNAADWPRPLLRGLVGLGFQVEAMDWPDSGRSERLAVGSYGITDLAREAMGYARASLAGTEVHWLGLSMGSLVAQELAGLGAPAASYTLLFTSAGSWGHGFGRLSTLARLLGVRVETTPEEATYALTVLREELAGRPAERDMAELRRRVQASVARAWPYARGPWRQLAAVTDYFSGGGTRLSGLGAPTLILHGTLDPLLPVAGARALSQRLKGSHYVELPEIGHELLSSRLGAMMTPLSAHLLAASGCPRDNLRAGTA